MKRMMIVILFLSFAVHGRAQETSLANGQSITIQECYAMAVKQNKTTSLPD